ncbi:MAG TPA: AAA family ATPase [Caldimonas sp.]|nr:AAA family ATPase [Caldimonas sp.]HEX2542945.1 AAA family ATPase [Caldimonas sp.]
MNEHITLLHSQGPLMTKVWTPEGIEPYQDARTFRVEQREVANISELSALLFEIEGDALTCIIRGGYVGDEQAKKLLPELLAEERRSGKRGSEPPAGTTLRRTALFPDRPLSMLLIDIDAFTPSVDALADPEGAIGEFVAAHLPDGFFEISYHWQLSASAGSAKNVGVLKAHVWFWLDQPRTCAQLHVWASQHGGVDKTLMQPVQVHYTAKPVFKGVPDPVPRRSGFYGGILGDAVALQVSAETEAAAKSPRPDRRAFVDPTTKPGLIGAFCRMYRPADLCELCPDLFSPGRSDRNMTWLEGAGSPNGVVICDIETHLWNQHNSAPTSGAVNLWDFIRLHKFGHLDHGKEDIAALDFSALPSEQAMQRWVREEHPEVPDVKLATPVSHSLALSLPLQGASSRPRGRVMLKRGSEILPTVVTWLWRHWLAAGKFHILAGQPGQGKTTLALKFAATVTSGGVWPDGTRADAGNVIMWSGEDDPSDTLIPRLLAMGGDASKFYVICGVRHDDEQTATFNPAQDLLHLLEAAEAIGSASLLLLDPVVSVVEGDSHKNAEMRKGLQPVVDLAAQMNASVLGISHFSKGTAGRDTTERVTGSVAFTAVARVVLCAAKAAGEVEDDSRRVLVRAKSNVGPRHPCLRAKRAGPA